MKNTKALRSPLLAIVVLLLILGVSRLFGLGSVRSGLRVGYISHESHTSWSASYVLLNGFELHTLRPKAPPETLYLEVETVFGSISIEVTDSEGNVIFYAADMGTGVYTTEVPEKVTVRVTADHHKGSFNIHT